MIGSYFFVLKVFELKVFFAIKFELKVFMFYGFYHFHKRKRVAQTKQRAGLHGAKFQRNFAPRSLGTSPQQASMIASCPACWISENIRKAYICRGVAAAQLAAWNDKADEKYLLR